MPEKARITDIFDRLGTPPVGRKIVLDARMHAPVREVASKGGNVITWLASRKMGCEIGTESRHIEFAAAIDKEYDPGVLEYYPQPCKLKFELVDDRTGEFRTIHHTPDFLVVQSGGITLEEWKSEVKLVRLAEQYPYRYVSDGGGNWSSPQIEQQLAERGIHYRIRSDQSLSRRWVDNIIHLADYFHPAAEPCPLDVLSRLNAALHEHGALTFRDLLDPPYSFTADALNKAIADQLVVADLHREALRDTRRFRLYRDEVFRDFLLADAQTNALPGRDRFAFVIAVGTKFGFDGQELTIIVTGEERVVCNRADGSTIELRRDWLKSAHEQNRITLIQATDASAQNLSSYSKADLDLALRRHAMLESDTAVPVDPRTLRRWSALQRTARANGAYEVLALVPRTRERGNRTSRLSQEQIALMERVIDEEWRNNRAVNYKACYRALLVAFDDAGETPPSYPTLIARIKAIETRRDVRTRHGKRMAYQKDTFVDVLYYDTPIHGSRPFQYVHIDHTQLETVMLRTIPIRK